LLDGHRGIKKTHLTHQNLSSVSWEMGTGRFKWFWWGRME